MTALKLEQEAEQPAVVAQVWEPGSAPAEDVVMTRREVDYEPDLLLSSGA